MDPQPSGLRVPQPIDMSSAERHHQEVKKIAVERNKAGAGAFMNNAAVDNYGTKAYHDCIFGDVSVQLHLDLSTAIALMRSGSQSSWPHLPEGIGAVPFKAISSASEPTSASTPNKSSVQLNSNTGRKSGKAYAKVCPDLGSNWISGDMYRRCKLQSKRRQTPKEIRYGGNLLKSTGHLVEFSCAGKSCKHRFHIIENAPLRFDLLYGAEFVVKSDG